MGAMVLAPPADSPRHALCRNAPDGPARTAGRAAALYRIVLRDLVVSLLIGVYEHEHRRPQRVAIGVDLTVRHPGAGFRDEIAAVLSYDALPPPPPTTMTPSPRDARPVSRKPAECRARTPPESWGQCLPLLILSLLL